MGKDINDGSVSGQHTFRVFSQSGVFHLKWSIPSFHRVRFYCSTLWVQSEYELNRVMSNRAIVIRRSLPSSLAERRRSAPPHDRNSRETGSALPAVPVLNEGGSDAQSRAAAACVATCGFRELTADEGGEEGWGAPVRSKQATRGRRRGKRRAEVGARGVVC